MIYDYFYTSLHNHFLTTHNLVPLHITEITLSKITKFLLTTKCNGLFVFLQVILSPWKSFKVGAISYQICVLYLIVAFTLLDLHLIGVVQIILKHSLFLHSRRLETSYPATQVKTMFLLRTYIFPHNRCGSV